MSVVSGPETSALSL